MDSRSYGTVRRAFTECRGEVEGQTPRRSCWSQSSSQPLTPDPCHVSREPWGSPGGRQGWGQQIPMQHPDIPAPCAQTAAVGPWGIFLPFSLSIWEL